MVEARVARVFFFVCAGAADAAFGDGKGDEGGVAVGGGDGGGGVVAREARWGGKVRVVGEGDVSAAVPAVQASSALRLLVLKDGDFALEEAVFTSQFRQLGRSREGALDFGAADCALQVF